MYQRELRSSERPRFTTTTSSGTRMRNVATPVGSAGPVGPVAGPFVPVDPRPLPPPTPVPVDPRPRPQPQQRLAPRTSATAARRTKAPPAPWSMAACRTWSSDPLTNPLTKRKIKDTGALYKRIKDICAVGQNSKACKTFTIMNNTRHPLTSRKLITTAKRGLYVQLREICDSRPRTPLQPNHARLVAAIQKTIRPLLHKGDDLKSRITFAKIVRKYIRDTAAVPSCLTNSATKLVLKEKGGQDMIVFDRSGRIGSKSKFGIAHMHAGRGFHRLVKFASKMMAWTQTHAEEVEILEKMTSAVEKQFTPNLPITYFAEACTTPCRGRSCPAAIKGKPYFIILNELADMDLNAWFKTKRSDPEYSSVIVQIILGIYAFHRLGYVHQDTHLGNFLVHKITPGGYWKYKVDGLDFYVKNTGYLVVLWDPGMAQETVSASLRLKDLIRPIGLIYDMKRAYANTKRFGRMHQPPDSVRDSIRGVIDDLRADGGNDEASNIQYAMITMASKSDAVKVQTKAPGRLLNVKPYLV